MASCLCPEASSAAPRLATVSLSSLSLSLSGSIRVCPTPASPRPTNFASSFLPSFLPPPSPILLSNHSCNIHFLAVLLIYTTCLGSNIPPRYTGNAIVSLDLQHASSDLHTARHVLPTRFLRIAFASLDTLLHFLWLSRSRIWKAITNIKSPRLPRTMMALTSPTRP